MKPVFYDCSRLEALESLCIINQVGTRMNSSRNLRYYFQSSWSSPVLIIISGRRCRKNTNARRFNQTMGVKFEATEFSTVYYVTLYKMEDGSFTSAAKYLPVTIWYTCKYFCYPIFSVVSDSQWFTLFLIIEEDTLQFRVQIFEADKGLKAQNLELRAK